IVIDNGAGATTIGAAGAAATNVISQNFGNGVHLNNSSGNTIQNTLIGLAINGTTAVGNTLDGVLVENNSDNNIIGGADLTLSNSIAANGQNGIHIKDSTSPGNQIQSNRIGLTVAGDVALPNQGNGVLVENAPNTLVGSTATASTFISGNALNGVSIVGAGAAGTIVANTRIGLNVTGDKKVGNGL